MLVSLTFGLCGWCVYLAITQQWAVFQYALLTALGLVGGYFKALAYLRAAERLGGAGPRNERLRVSSEHKPDDGDEE